MLEKIAKLIGVTVAASFLYACGGEMSIRDQHSVEYLESAPGKPVIYPTGVKVPEQSQNYIVPKLTAEQEQAKYDLDELARPPRLVPKPAETKPDMVEGQEDNN